MPIWPFHSTLACPIVGMVHLPPLPGSAGVDQSMDEVVLRAVQDAKTLESAGVSALMIENFGDVPFYPDRVPAVVVAAMTTVATELRREIDLPLGVNVLRNDGESALAIAIAVGASFIRVNVLTGVSIGDQGVLAGRAHDLLRMRRWLGASRVGIWADVRVKHAAPLAERPLVDEVHDLASRGGADAVIVTGAATGKPASNADVDAVRSAACGLPVVLGSGVNVDSLDLWLPRVDAMIVGSGLKHDGVASRPVCEHRARSFMDRVDDWRNRPATD